MMLSICLITFLATVTKKRKIQTISKNISTPSMALNEFTSPNEEENGKDAFPLFRRRSNMNKVSPLIQIFLDLYNYKSYD